MKFIARKNSIIFKEYSHLFRWEMGGKDMSLDIKAFKTLIDNGYGLDFRDEISSFTFSHRLNDYWGAKELFTSNYDELMPAIKYNLAFDTYVYFRETIKRLKQINDENNFGDDVTEYLKEILESNADIIYMQIF